jgi:hypothetical protein
MPQPADFGGFWRILLQLGSLSIGISCCDGSDMPTVTSTIARIANTRQWIISRVIAKSARSGEPVFTLMDVLLYGRIALWLRLCPEF